MTKEEILPDVIKYFNGDELAASVWADKYALRDKNDCIYERTPEDMHRRMAKEFARIEANYPNPMTEDQIFELFDRFKYVVPQGSPMFGIGNDFTLTSLANCFVIGNNDNADSYGSIMRADEEQIQIMKRRGGVGQDLSHLRPSGSLANNSALKGMTGAVSYAQRYSNSTKEVRQGDRRGALMLSMSCMHPDAEKFINAKLTEGAITDANVSVKIIDEFMEAVKEDRDVIQVFPTELELILSDEQKSSMPYDKLVKLKDAIINGQQVYIKKVKVKKLWDKIVRNAWKSAEPGVLFWDHIIRESPADVYDGFRTISTNPCGEIPLAAYDSCRLLLINLYSYVNEPFTSNAHVNFMKLQNHVVKAQRLMDDLVDLEIEKIDRIIEKINNDPESEDVKRVERKLWQKIKEMAIAGRRTGLGITAEGDMLAALGLTYGTEEATKISEEVHRIIATYSYISSIQMAKERDSFAQWDVCKEENNPFIKRVLASIIDIDPAIIKTYNKFGRRNIANLTIAPAGSVSILTQTTSGVEPCFNVAYKRRRRTIDKAKATFTDDRGEMFEEYYVFHHKFLEWLQINSYIVDGTWTFDPKDTETLNNIIAKSPYHKATSADVNWVDKVNMQGRIQKWVDHSISSTTNIPNSTPVSEVEKIYMAAYESGCKGMTIYREGSRSGILVSEKKEKFTYVDALKRPKDVACDIYHKTALKQNWMILVGVIDDKPYEIFAFPEPPNHSFPLKINKGNVIKVKRGIYKLTAIDETGKEYEIKNIIDLLENGDAISTRKFSMMLRHAIDPRWIIEDIEKYSLITSFDKVVQRVLRNYVAQEKTECPECGENMTMSDGCAKCMNCGYSKCG